MAITKNISVDQGSNFTDTLSIEVLTNPALPEGVSNPYIPLNLTNYTARMQVRSSYDSSVVVLSATTSNGRLVIDAANGKITLKLLPADTSALIFKGETADYVYDEEIEDNLGNVLRVVQGAFSISREVTR